MLQLLHAAGEVAKDEYLIRQGFVEALEKPGQPRENGGTVRLPKRHHDDTVMMRMNQRDGVVEVAVGSENYRNPAKTADTSSDVMLG